MPSRSLEHTFDVIVVGGGHAGTEAAVGAARLGASVALVTSALETIGQMSCNPAIGGVAKGTVVREVDALGGIMARATDMATLQFRMLNRSKGPAVWAPRAQCDRALYRRAARTLLEAHPTLVTIQGTVSRLIIEDGAAVGIETLEGRAFGARAVVITTGTFLRGRIHIGTETRLAGGRAGESATTHLAEQLDAAGLTVARFKTGTPPRIDGRESELAQFEYRWSHFWSDASRGGAADEDRAAFDAADTGDALRAFDPSAASDASAARATFDRSDARDFDDAHPADPRHLSIGGAPRDPIGTREPGTREPANPAPTPLPQLPCWITYLEEPGKRIIADNIGRSAMYGGAIASRGPRYCPSVEDKIVKFPDAERHQLFLEPEGLETREMYVNGLSTSLPPDVQLAVLRSVRGLERVRMTRAGYAIEYDYFPPTQLDATLQVKALRALFFAGQINGTTGYEEAAGQGIVAGLNAALLALGRDPLILGRESSYIGVLVDDLVTRGVDEPYRLFTSRSEFRLTVRQDNALRRLAPIGLALGLYDGDEHRTIARRFTAEDHALALAARTSITPEQTAPVLERAGSAPLAHAVPVAEVAKRQHVALAHLFAAADVGASLPLDAVIAAELELKYAGYFKRERLQAERMRRMGDVALADDLQYDAMRSLTVEARQKLAALRPRTLAQASRIPGVSPSDLQNLLVEIARARPARD